MAILKDLLVQSDARVVGVTRSASFEGDGLLAATSGNRDNNKVWNTNGGFITVDAADEKVNQSQTTTSSYRGVVLGYNTSSTSGTGIDGSVTNVVYTTNNLTVQPSTGNFHTKGTIQSKDIYSITSATYNVGTSGNVWNTVWAQNFKSNSALIVASSGNTAISMQTSGATRMTIHGGGNVGIGTTSPSTKLHIYGDEYIQPTSDTTLGIDASSYKIGNTRRDLHIKVTSGSGTGVTDGNAAGITFGNDTSTSYAGIYVQSSGNYGTRMIFGTTGSYANGAYGRMIIGSNGYVGILTMSPSYPLHVVGNTYTSNKFISTGLKHNDTSLTGTSPYRFWTTNGSYTTLGLSGSTAIGSTTQPIYWNGNNFVTASTYPFVYGTGSNSVKLNLGSITSSGDRSFAFGGGVEATNTYSFAFGGYLYSSAAGSVAFGQGGIASGQFSFVRGGNWWIGIKLTGAANATTYTISDETSDKNFLHWLYNQLGQTAFNSLITKTRLLNNSTGQIFTITASNITKSGNSLTGSITTNAAISTSALTNYEAYILSQIADGKASVSDGNGTLALGRSSHAEGEQVIAQNQAEHAQGMNNYSRKATTTFGNSGNTHFSVGIGSDGFNAKNAIEIMQNGDFYLYGAGNYNGTNSTVSGVSTLQSLLTTLINRKYWANVELTSSADTTKEPTFKTATIQNDSTHKCKMLYDSTEECMKFTFA